MADEQGQSKILPKKCQVSACSRPLAEWDRHLFCVGCRACAPPETSCDICAKWNAETLQKFKAHVENTINLKPDVGDGKENQGNFLVLIQRDADLLQEVSVDRSQSSMMSMTLQIEERISDAGLDPEASQTSSRAGVAPSTWESKKTQEELARVNSSAAEKTLPEPGSPVSPITASCLKDKGLGTHRDDPSVQERPPLQASAASPCDSGLAGSHKKGESSDVLDSTEQQLPTDHSPSPGEDGDCLHAEVAVEKPKENEISIAGGEEHQPASEAKCTQDSDQLAKDYDSDGWELCAENEPSSEHSGDIASEASSTQATEEEVSREDAAVAEELPREQAASELSSRPSSQQEFPESSTLLDCGGQRETASEEGSWGLPVKVEPCTPVKTNDSEGGINTMYLRRSPRVSDAHSSEDKNKNLPVLNSNDENESSGEKCIFNCPLCFQSFTDRQLLQRHQERHQLTSHFLCDLCKKTFRARRYLVRHRRDVHGIAPAGRRGKRASSVLIHSGRNSGRPAGDSKVPGNCSSVRKFRCNVCNKSYLTHQYLVQHKRICHGIKPTRALSRQNAAQNGRKSRGIDYESCILQDHPPVKLYSCDVCNKKYKYEKCVAQHKKVVHNIKPAHGEAGQNLAGDRRTSEVSPDGNSVLENPPSVRFPCNVCEKTFKYKRDLVQHKKVKHGIIPPRCRVRPNLGRDGRAFEISPDQNTVLENHPSVRFACGVCDKSFKNKKDLVQHKKVKHGIKPTRGKVNQNLAGHEGTAEKSVKDKSVLENHPSVRFPCDVCKKTFTSKPHVVRHMKEVHGILIAQGRVGHNHAGHRGTSGSSHKDNNVPENHPSGRRFPCDTCKKTFSTKHHAYRHKREVHSNIPRHGSRTSVKKFPCDMCGKLFKRQRYVVQHKKCMHGIEPGIRKCAAKLSQDSRKSAYHDKQGTLNDQVILKNAHNSKLCSGSGKKCLTPVKIANKSPKTRQEVHPVSSRNMSNKKGVSQHARVKCREEKDSKLQCPLCLMHFLMWPHLRKHMDSVHGLKFSHFLEFLQERHNQEEWMSVQRDQVECRASHHRETESLDSQPETDSSADTEIPTSTNLRHDGARKSRVRKRSSSGEQSSQYVHSHNTDTKRARMSQTFDREHHLVEHTGSDSWHCPICSKNCLKHSVQEHMVECHEGVSFCKKCYVLVPDEGMDVCIKCSSANQTSGLRCGTCKLYFESPSLLTKHILSHETEDEVHSTRKLHGYISLPHLSLSKSLPAEKDNGKSMPSSANNGGVVPPEETPAVSGHRCCKCGKQGIPSGELHKHARTHLFSKSEFQCNTCQELSADLDQIEEHIAVAHEGPCSFTVVNRSYQCKGCDRSFNNFPEAQKHVLSTNAACKHACSHCCMAFDRQGDLMVHLVKVHSIYLECVRCSAQFAHQVDLQNHMKLHKGTVG